MPPTSDVQTIRASHALERVTELYARACGGKAPTSPGGEGGAGNGPGSRPPLRLAVLDAQRAVEEDLNRSWPEITTAAGAGRAADRDREDMTARTRARLDWLAVHLADVLNGSPALGPRLTAEWLKGGNLVLGALGERARPFQTAGLCPSCGTTSLWASPEDMLIRCAVCYQDWPIETSLLQVSC